MQVTTSRPYTDSVRRRMRVLFSPVRVVFLVAAVVFAVALNIVFISNGGYPEWVGPLSVAPLLVFLGWTLATDYSHRRSERTTSR